MAFVRASANAGQIKLSAAPQPRYLLTDYLHRSNVGFRRNSPFVRLTGTMAQTKTSQSVRQSRLNAGRVQSAHAPNGGREAGERERQLCCRRSRKSITNINILCCRSLMGIRSLGIQTVRRRSFLRNRLRCTEDQSEN
jgi:hypothetical protein